MRCNKNSGGVDSYDNDLAGSDALPNEGRMSQDNSEGAHVGNDVCSMMYLTMWTKALQDPWSLRLGIDRMLCCRVAYRTAHWKVRGCSCIGGLPMCFTV